MPAIGLANLPTDSVASASTCNIGATSSIVVNITGTTTITSFGSAENTLRFIVFAAALTLTHGASLILPGATNRTVSAGDTALAVSDASAIWRVFFLTKASGHVRATAGSDGEPGYTFIGDSNTGLFNLASDQLCWVAGGARIIANDSSGRIGLQGGILSATARVYNQYAADEIGYYMRSTAAAYTSRAYFAAMTAASGTGWHFLDCYSDAASDRKFRVRGDGATFADGAYTGTGADYAEWCEWEDGNPAGEDRVGRSVVFAADGKIRLASDQDDLDDVIGVVSSAPAVIGNGAENGWRGRYAVDEWGRILTEDYQAVQWQERRTNPATGEPGLWETHSYELGHVPEDVVVPVEAETVTATRFRKNPAFDPAQVYEPRSARPEWATVGVLGRLRLRAGEPTHPRWKKLRDVASGIEEWWVR